MEVWIFFALIAAFALIRTPLFIILAAATLLFKYFADDSFAAIIISYTELSKQNILMAIPLFTFAGFIFSESKTPERLINLTNAMFGYLPGGLAIVALVTCAIFTAFTGASGVTIIALGGLLYPLLIKQNYPEKFALGLMTTSGSLGLLFAPSVPIILYGIVSQTDISKLFKAGLIPGILLIVILGIYSMIVGSKANVVKIEPPLKSIKDIIKDLKIKSLLSFFATIGILLYLTFGDYELNKFYTFLLVIFSVFLCLKYFNEIVSKDTVVLAFNNAKYEIFLPILVITGIYSGQFTATESASVTAFYVIIIECFIYKDLNFFKDIPRITADSMVMVSAILIIMASALAFTNFLIDEQIPDLILETIKKYIDSKVMFLIALNILLLIVGCLMDIFSAILVVVPLIVPIANEYGVNPVHLGMIFLTNLEIGYLTPPVGLNLFLASYRFNKNIVTLYRASISFIIMLLIALMIITYVPELSLFLVE